MIHIPKGTKDVLPADAYKWHFVEGTARRIAALYDLAEGRGKVVVATAEGLLQKVPERERFHHKTFP